MRYREYFVHEVIDKILATEPGDEFNFCENYDPNDVEDATAHSSWYGVYSTVVADNPVAIMAKYGMGDVGIVDLGSDFAREDLVRYFGDLNYKVNNQILVEEDGPND